MLTFQQLARNIYEVAQFDRAANERTTWDNETLAVKLRYQRAAKVALGLPAISLSDMRMAFTFATSIVQEEGCAPSVTDWLRAGVEMPSFVLAEIGHAIQREA